MADTEPNCFLRQVTLTTNLANSMSDESFLCQIMFLQTHTDHPTKSKAAIPWLWHLSVWGLGHLYPLPLIHGGWAGRGVGNCYRGKEGLF